jgi:hypothetical protein
MINMKFFVLAILFFALNQSSQAQCYWQQKVDYKIDIQFDDINHQFKGTEKLVYTNNSPDTLSKVYFHLYYNAFQPGSMMSVRQSIVPDPDPRFPLMGEMAQLKDNEIGYQKINSLKQDGAELRFSISYTTLEVKLAKPLLPKQKTTFDMAFEAQVPLQIRRTGRNSFDGVDYSMAQWFPKMAEYDKNGWHAQPYVAREFYAPWGNYEVNITINKDYTLAGTGIVQNPNEVQHGYEKQGTAPTKSKDKTLTWRFKAENVHDFVWAADKDYVHTTAQVPNGPLLRFFYVKGEETKLWENELPSYAVKTFEFAEKNFGKYGWPEYSIIHGGDGGMEYPMVTLIINKKRDSGVRSLNSLVGTMVHEVMHSWYQGMLATNESYFAWMDEGFASFAEEYILNEIFDEGKSNPMASTVARYIRWTKTGMEEPANTHSDHFNTNSAYGQGSYTKGAVALTELGYIIGDEAMRKGLIKYRNEWGFKHPDSNDFIRLMEKESNLELHWFFDYWINTTKTIDYAINSVTENQGKTSVTLERKGQIPMPMDITVTKKDGTKSMYYAPLGIMRGEKINESGFNRTVLSDWFWTHPTYSFNIDIPLSQIKKIEIDESERMADVNRDNNVFDQE